MNYLDLLARRIQDEVPDHSMPEQTSDQLFRSYAVLAQALGAQVSNEDVHNAWVAWMSNIDPDHASLVLYADLPPDERAEDSVFVLAIRRVAPRKPSGCT